MIACHEEVLEASKIITNLKGKNKFSPEEVIT
jgi:hypothetical protein